MYLTEYCLVNIADGNYEEGTRTILQFLVCLANIDNSAEKQFVGDGLWQEMPQLEGSKV